MNKRMPPSRLKDLTGQQFGRLTVISRNGHSGRSAAWLCQCSCGTVTTKSSKHLLGGVTKSCGCYRSEVLREVGKTHGMTNSKEFRTWKGIKERCLQPSSKVFHSYGGRGITMCDRWRDFVNFYADMGPAPEGKPSIDRIDNSGPYSPENCRWASMKEQANNRGNNVVVSFSGSTMTLKEWAEKTGISYNVLHHRHRRGWSSDRMLTQPKGNYSVPK